MARQRIEDLGRLMVMIQHIYDQHIFNCRLDKHNFVEYYLPESVYETDEGDIFVERLSDLERQISVIKSHLADCIDICQGEDILNKDIDA